ncbi:hypothetical protein FB451DRAFT_1172459 [Mycena latifolia]|nr:hypothetical protein FB451DRAFT_1172459 [Mycena latifolia]
MHLDGGVSIVPTTQSFPWTHIKFCHTYIKPGMACAFTEWQGEKMRDERLKAVRFVNLTHVGRRTVRGRYSALLPLPPASYARLNVALRQYSVDNGGSAVLCVSRTFAGTDTITPHASVRSRIPALLWESAGELNFLLLSHPRLAMAVVYSFSLSELTRRRRTGASSVRTTHACTLLQRAAAAALGVIMNDGLAVNVTVFKLMRAEDERGAAMAVAGVVVPRHASSPATPRAEFARAVTRGESVRTTIRVHLPLAPNPEGLVRALSVLGLLLLSGDELPAELQLNASDTRPTDLGACPAFDECGAPKVGRIMSPFLAHSEEADTPGLDVPRRL